MHEQTRRDKDRERERERDCDDIPRLFGFRTVYVPTIYISQVQRLAHFQATNSCLLFISTEKKVVVKVDVE